MHAMKVGILKIIGVIPARYGSTRFPGKPLTLIAGRPMLDWVIEGAQQSQSIEQIIVATDDERIAEVARNAGVDAVMTDSDLPSGSDRVWAAVSAVDCDIVVNIQGDEPLLSGGILDALVRPFYVRPTLAMATLGRRLQAGDLESMTTAKIILDENGDAIYFSRYPIPFSRCAHSQFDMKTFPCLKHIGLYAFKKQFLQAFCQQKPADIELAEGLEQLRALSMGVKIAVSEVEHESWGVDTPEDVAKIELLLAKRKS